MKNVMQLADKLEKWCKNVGISTKQGDLPDIIKEMRQINDLSLGNVVGSSKKLDHNKTIEKFKEMTKEEAESGSCSYCGRDHCSC